ncbi:MAG: hypothetical protein JW820_04200 [Spirochaetales bacterium]|nr:hypothetical protein [Spirochaetales bacterium]
MGMFDTIVFPAPIACRQCGAPIVSTQTKQFGCLLDTYRVGDVIPHSPVVLGVLEEELYCEPCKRFDQKVYLTLWHSLLVGVYQDRAEAEGCVASVDRAEILGHLVAHQTEERRLRRLLHGLLNTLHSYAEYLAADDKEAFLSAPFAFLGTCDLREHLAAAAEGAAGEAASGEAKAAATLLSIIERCQAAIKRGHGDDENGGIF